MPSLPLRGTHVPLVLEALQSRGLAPSWYPAWKEGMLSPGRAASSVPQPADRPRGAPNHSQLAGASGEAAFLLVQAPLAGTSLSPENAPEDFHPTRSLWPSSRIRERERDEDLGRAGAEKCPLQVPGLPSRPPFIRGRRSRPSWGQTHHLKGFSQKTQMWGCEHLLLPDLCQDRELETASHTFPRGLPQPPALLGK